MFERTISRVLFLTFDSDTCSESTKRSRLHLSISVAVDFFSKMDRTDQLEYSYFWPYRKSTYTTNLKVFKNSVANLTQNELRPSISNRQIVKFVLSNYKKEGFGRPCYYWIFSDLPQPQITELLRPLTYPGTTIFILRSKHIIEKKHDGGHYFYSPAPTQNIFERTQWFAQTTLETFFIPHLTIVRFGSLETPARLSANPDYHHTFDVINILGFSPMNELSNVGTSSQHHLVAQKRGCALLLSALRSNLIQENLFAIARFDLDGPLALILPSADGELAVLILNSKMFLPYPWSLKLSGHCLSERSKTISVWSEKSVDFVLAFHPSTVMSVLLSCSLNLPENLSKLTKKLKFVLESDVVCLSIKQKDKIWNALRRGQRTSLEIHDDQLYEKYKLAFNILNRMKTIPLVRSPPDINRLVPNLPIPSLLHTGAGYFTRNFTGRLRDHREPTLSTSSYRSRDLVVHRQPYSRKRFCQDSRGHHYSDLILSDRINY